MIGIRKFTTIAAVGAMSLGLLTVPTASARTSTGTAAYDCPDGWMCLYSQTGGYGERLQYQNPGYWQNLRFTARSFYNNRGNDAAVAVGSGGSGGQFCVPSEHKNGNTTAKSVYLAYTDGNC